MSNKSTLKPLSIALGTVVTISLANVSIASATGNPFSMEPLSGGYMMLAEGKCGEGKCGGSKGKGMEGSCGMSRMDANGDGNITHEEFMQGHEEMFKHIDTNNDGVIDASEREAHMKTMRGKMQGKGAEGKCGGSK